LTTCLVPTLLAGAKLSTAAKEVPQRAKNSAITPR
jgi:hypothetical protein